MKESLDLFPAGGIHRRVSARSPQLTGQPRLGGSPIAQDGGLGYAEQLGALRHVEAAEEPALDHQCLTRLEAGERLEGGLETEQLIRGAPIAQQRFQLAALETVLRSDAAKRHDANSCGPAQCRIDASLPTGGRSGRHSKPSARNSITREARVQPATEDVRPPLPIPPSQTFRGIMRDSVLKHWMRSGLVLVAGLAVVTGCGKDGGTGPAADYTLSLAPAALTIVQGATGNTTVTITRTNFTDAVTLSLSCAPPRVAGAFNPAAPTGNTSTLTVSVGAAVAPGVYNLTVDGTGAPGNRSTPLALTVSAAPDYTLSLAPAALTIAQGATGTTTLTITRTNFTGAVTLSLGNARARVTGS